MAVYLFVASASSVQVVISLAVVMAVIGVARLPAKPRRMVCAAVGAWLVAGLGVAQAVPFHCDPVWKYLGICGR